MRMALDWSQAMHQDMSAALHSYRTTTAGAMGAVDAMNAITSDLAFRAERQRRLHADVARETNR